jgi:SAM-dependent methyltransferase
VSVGAISSPQMPGEGASGSSEEARCIVCGGARGLGFEKLGYEIHRCERCGLGAVVPLPSQDTLADFYADAYYGSGSDLGYPMQYEQLEVGLKKMYRRFLRRVERRHPQRRFDRVLDVGCAYGFFLDVAESHWRPSELVGVDISPEAATHNTRPGRTFHAGFIEDVELPDGHFDFVFMGDALEHVREPLRVADQLARVLAPDGVLLLTTVDFGSRLARWLGARWRLLCPPEHLHFWTRPSLERLFADRGLHGELFDYWFFYPKPYVYERTRAQFGFTPRFLALVPGELIPVPSFDAVATMLWRRQPGDEEPR